MSATESSATRPPPIENPPQSPPQETGRFPSHWGEPPSLQTRDLRQLPLHYGMGSSTLSLWIIGKLALDESNGNGDIQIGGNGELGANVDGIPFRGVKGDGANIQVDELGFLVGRGGGGQ